jgi:hypothetical protein
MAVACPCPETWVWGSTLQGKSRHGKRHVKKKNIWWVEGHTHTRTHARTHARSGSDREKDTDEGGVFEEHNRVAGS